MSFVGKTHDELEALGRIVSQLHNLSAALYTTGQVQLADDLSGYAREIAEARNELDKLIGDRINQGFNDAMQNSATILNTALATSHRCHP